MTYTQIDYHPSHLPNVWERYYNMPDGNIAVMTKTDTTGDNINPEVTYSVITHTEVPIEPNDWWDSVIKEVAYCDTLEAAEAAVAELLKV